SRAFLANGRGSPVARARIARATWTEPAAVLADTLRPGLTYAYFEGEFRSADDVRQGQPLRVGTVPEVGLRGDARPETSRVRLAVSTPGSAKQPVPGQWFAHGRGR